MADTSEPAAPAEAASDGGTGASARPTETAPPARRAPAPRLRQRASERFRREDRQEFRYLLSIATAVITSWAVWLMPPPLRSWIANRLGDAFFRLSGTYRRNVIDNVSTVMGLSADSPEVISAARRIFRLSARNFGALLLFPRQSRQSFVRSLKLVEGEWSYIERAQAEGRGVVLLAAHLGSFDFAGHAISMRGYKVTSVTGRTAARFIFDAVTYLRRSHGAEIVEATPAGVRRVIQALRRGECVAFLGDYDFFQNGRAVTFFGRPTTLPPGAIRIARETGAVVIGTFARRGRDGDELAMTEPFLVEKTDDLDRDLDRGLARVVTLLERAISASPDQWVMFQRVWPAAPVDPVRVFPVGSPLESALLERVGAVLPGPRGES